MGARSATIFPEELNVRIDGRLADHALLEEQRFETERLLTALSWKSGLDPHHPLIVCVMGGTGTGKSTLFNSLAGEVISNVGIRRPSTLKPVISVHENFVERITECPFIGPFHQGPEGGGNQAEIRVLPHRQEESAGLVLVDSPDFDSVELSNRVIADNFFVISDMMLFVTSQEKYGDLVGHQILERAVDWGKHTVVVMNKVTSDRAFEDFREMLRVSLGRIGEPIRVGRFTPSPEIIPGIRDRAEFSALLRMGAGSAEVDSIREEELARLRGRTASSVENLRTMLASRLRRVESVNFQIRLALSRVSADMEKRLDAVLSEDIERRLRDRLRSLLNKYDIFSAPRMMVRRAIRKALGMVAGIFTPQVGGASLAGGDKEARIEDFETTRSSAKLKPLEWAVARLDLEVAEILSSDSALEDLRLVAKNDIPRWDSGQIRSLFDEAFPGVENLLESEFERLRQGLSRADELKLYGSYTLWALVLITAEIVMGGGLTLLDVLLSTVVLPFIPKWLLSLKVLDILRDIGERVDQEYRHILRSILEKRAKLYTDEFRGLLPDEEALYRLKGIRTRLDGEI